LSPSNGWFRALSGVVSQKIIAGRGSETRIKKWVRRASAKKSGPLMRGGSRHRFRNLRESLFGELPNRISAGKWLGVNLIGGKRIRHLGKQSPFLQIGRDTREHHSSGRERKTNHLTERRGKKAGRLSNLALKH